MENSGKIKIDNIEYNVFLEKVGTTNTTTNKVEEIPTDSSIGIIIVTPRYDSESKQFVASLSRLGKTPTEISWDSVKYYPFSVIRQNVNTNATYWVKINNISYKIEIITADIHSTPVIVNFNNTGDNVIIEETTPVVDSTTPPVVVQPQVDIIVPSAGKYQKESAIIGQIYKCKEKVRVLFCSHGDHPKNYYYNFKKDGIIVYENFSERPKMPSDRTADYMGDHPLETQLALEEGVYEVFVQNFLDDDILFGNITKDQYIQYSNGGLSWADWWVKIKKGESSIQYITLSEKCKKDSLIIGGYSKEPSLSITRPFYKDGKVYIQEMRIEGSPNGVELKQDRNSTIKYYSAVEPDHNITIEFIPSGVGGDVSFKVVEKNNLDVDPNTFMATCFNTSYSKFFCHDAKQFKDNRGSEV